MATFAEQRKAAGRRKKIQDAKDKAEMARAGKKGTSFLGLDNDGKPKWGK